MKTAQIGFFMIAITIALASQAKEQRMVKEGTQDFSQIISDGIKAERELRVQLHQAALPGTPSITLASVATNKKSFVFNLGEAQLPAKTNLKHHPRPDLIDVENRIDQRLAFEFDNVQ
jgi:hypothetical protein